MNDDNWIVYGHFKQTDLVPFYIGIGKDKKRPYDMRNSRNPWHKNIVKKHGVIVKILHDQLTKESASWWERIWIKVLKKLNYNLSNLTSGGDGISGYRHTEETKKKIGNYGKSLGNNHHMKNPIICKKVSETKKLNYKIAGSNHPNRMKGENHASKRPEVASKIKSTMKTKSYIYLVWFSKCVQWQNYWGA